MTTKNIHFNWLLHGISRLLVFTSTVNLSACGVTRLTQPWSKFACVTLNRKGKIKLGVWDDRNNKQFTMQNCFGNRNIGGENENLAYTKHFSAKCKTLILSDKAIFCKGT